jgi:hypothetical protein
LFSLHWVLVVHFFNLLLAEFRNRGRNRRCRSRSRRRRWRSSTGSLSGLRHSLGSYNSLLFSVLILRLLPFVLYLVLYLILLVLLGSFSLMVRGPSER